MLAEMRARSTPPELRVVAAAARDSNLPDKSRADYEKAYEKFLAWKEMKLCPLECLSENILLAGRSSAQH